MSVSQNAASIYSIINGNKRTALEMEGRDDTLSKLPPTTTVEDEYAEMTLSEPGKRNEGRVNHSVASSPRPKHGSQQPETSVNESTAGNVVHLNFFQGFHDDYDESDLS